MKLAKKMLAGVLALAIVAAFALTAFAAAPVVKLSATKFDKIGDEITIEVTATGLAGLAAADVEFTYDATALEFVSIEKPASALYDMGVGGLADGTTGVVTWSFFYTDVAKEDCGLATLKFKVLKEVDTKVVFRANSWTDADNNELEAPAAVGVMVKDKTPATTAAPETTTEVESTTAAPTTKAPTTAAPTTANKIPQTGEAGVAAIAGVMALAAVAFVATRKKDEE